MRTKTENGKLIIALEGRIDATNAKEWERALTETIDAHGGIAPDLDAADLEYISSAGLRVLLKLSKRLNALLRVLNVPPDVYEIFETTGFTDLLYVTKGYRRLSIEGLPLIGQGATASVYRLSPETVVKIYKHTNNLGEAKLENDRSRNAFVSGIPTAIAFEIVKVGDSYGAVYELLDAEVLVTMMENDKAHLEEPVRKFAALIRKINHIEVSPDKFLQMKPASISLLPQLEAVCTKEETDKLRSLLESVPDRVTFLHGDCHPANVMVQNGEYLFIDLMTSACGHPVFDLASMCSFYHFPQDEESRKNNTLLRNFTEEECSRIWDIFLRAYFDTEDEAYLRKAERQITAVSAVRDLFSTIFFPGHLSQERIDYLKSVALSYVDSGLEPFCF